MKISIVLPVYNVEKYIRKCLESIIYQNYKDFEIILVDDGSTDNSGKICDEYAKKNNRIKVLHKNNEGLYQARIDGAKIASGEYVWFVDSDDWIIEHSIEKINQYIEKYKEIDVLVFNYCINGNEKKRVRKIKVNEKENQKKFIIQELCKANTYNSIWTKCIKRNLIVENSDLIDRKGYCYGEDIVISAAVIAASHNIYIVDDALYAYRVENNGMTRKYNGKRLEDQKITLDTLCKYAITWSQEYAMDLKKYIQNRKTQECIGHLKMLLGSELSWKEKRKELEKLGKDMFFVESMTNQCYVSCDGKEMFLKKSFFLPPVGRLPMYRLYSCINYIKKRIGNVL